MKTIKYLLISLVIAFAIAGCASSSNGMSNFDAVEKATYTENLEDS